MYKCSGESGESFGTHITLLICLPNLYIGMMVYSNSDGAVSELIPVDYYIKEDGISVQWDGVSRTMPTPKHTYTPQPPNMNIKTVHEWELHMHTHTHKRILKCTHSPKLKCIYTHIDAHKCMHEYTYIAMDD